MSLKSWYFRLNTFTPRISDILKVFERNPMTWPDKNLFFSSVSYGAIRFSAFLKKIKILKYRWLGPFLWVKSQFTSPLFWRPSSGWPLCEALLRMTVCFGLTLSLLLKRLSSHPVLESPYLTKPSFGLFIKFSGRRRTSTSLVNKVDKDHQLPWVSNENCRPWSAERDT